MAKMAGDYSIDTGNKRTFGTVDYVLFSLMFVGSALIGCYHAYRDRNKKDVEEFHLGGRKMHPIPVSLSLVATFVSALTLLGTPAEIYANGTMYWWIIVAMFIATGAAAHVFVPVFYRLRLISCFEYLEMRFGKVLSVAVSIGFLLQTLLYMGFVLYAPSLALQSVTGLSLWGSMIGVAAVCTLYTMLGGMKTVLWTDSLQLVIVFVGFICIIVEGSKATGGFGAAWDIANERGRIYFTDFSADPRTRHSVWTVVIGGAFFWMYLYGVNQAQVQRACSLPTLRRAQLALWMNFPGLVFIISLCCMTGILMFAFYSDCDPVKFGLINRTDQLLPLFVMDILGNIPGLSGVFIACLFSGSLSTISSGLNALSAMFLEDFIKPCAFRCMTPTRSMILSKAMVLVVGVIQFGVAVAISRFTGLVMQFSYSMYSILAGPLFGVFISGMLLPWVNKVGALVGYLASLVLMLWLGFGTILAKLSSTRPPLSTAGCNWNVSSIPAPTTSAPSATTSGAVADLYTSGDPLDEYYRMSYLWYTGYGMVLQVVIALLVSFLTGYTKPSSVDSRLLCPIFDRLFPYLPETILRPLRCGVVYEKENEDDLKQKQNHGNSTDTNKSDLANTDHVRIVKNKDAMAGIDNEVHFTHL